MSWAISFAATAFSVTAVFVLVSIAVLVFISVRGVIVVSVQALRLANKRIINKTVFLIRIL